MFKPGDEVVCVDAGDQYGIYPCPLTEGARYIVIGVLPYYAIDGSDFSLDVGVPSRGLHGCWSPHRFRKVQKRSTETGMAILRGIADGTRTPEREKA